MSYKNPNILPRALSYEEKENRKKGIYDSFANYLVYCQKCKYVAKSNMYIQRAEAYIDELHEKSTVCPKCGEPVMPHRACKACGTYNGRQVKVIKSNVAAE